MIRHVVRLVLRRARANALVAVEILCCFIVVFVVAALGLYYLDNQRLPLGFDRRGVVDVEVDMKTGTDDEWTPEQVATFALLFKELRNLPDVVAVAGAMTAPYDQSTYAGDWTVEGRAVQMEFDEVTVGFGDVLQAELAGGRWFEEADAALGWRPVVLTRSLAREFFGDVEPLGRRLPGQETEDLRVVGVIDQFRKGGELSAPVNRVFYYKGIGDVRNRPPRHLLVRLRPGTPAGFEQEVVRRMLAVAPNWSFDARTLEQARSTARAFALVPLALAALVASFLLLMVALGLIGVLWQNVTRRTREFGLRRAVGASAAAVRGQLLLELVVLTVLATAAGVVMVVQIPLLGWLPVPGHVYAGAVLVAFAMVNGLTLAAGLYPATLATAVEPAAALHHD